MADAHPIILLGTHRSGTTWMGQALRQLPELSFVHEPRHIWTFGNGFKPDDALTEHDVTPRIARHIRREFDKIVVDRGGRRLAEKTPSNCLRVRFINAIYPGAKFAMIVRDGRSVLRSTGEILDSGVRTQRVWKRARQTPISQWPAQVPAAMSTVMRRITRTPLNYWGPRPPGWRDWLKGGDPRAVVLAKQWSGTVTPAWREGHSLGPDRFFVFKYEDLCHAPEPTLRRLCAFWGLEDEDKLVELGVQSLDASRVSKWRSEVDTETLELVRPHMEPALKELGYEW